MNSTFELYVTGLCFAVVSKQKDQFGVTLIAESAELTESAESAPIQHANY